jgi:hypothetical protein
MGENTPLAAQGAPLTGGQRSRWPTDLTARQLLRAADGLAQIAAASAGLTRQDLERDIDELRRRAWRLGAERSPA